MSEPAASSIHDFTAAAWALLAVDGAVLLLSWAGGHWAHLPYAAMVFLAVLRLPGTGLWGAVLNSQALFAPVTVTFLMATWPIWAQAGCWVLLFPALRGKSGVKKLGYFILSLAPALGPAAAAWLLMKNRQNNTQT